MYRPLVMTDYRYTEKCNELFVHMMKNIIYRAINLLYNI